MAPTPSSPVHSLSTQPSPARRRGLFSLSPAVLLSRGLLYGILALYVGTVYVLVLALGGLNPTGTFDINPPWWLNLVALLIIALTVLRVHAWLRVNVDRLVYDWHADPYAVLSELGQHLTLEAEQSSRAIVPTIAATIAATLQLPYVAVETGLGAAAETTAHGEAPPGARRLTIPLVYGGTPIGALHVTGRRPNESLSATDERVLRDLARQVEITLHAAQLSDALQTSRTQLVTAREEERRRIRNDLHDELAPTLSSLQLQLGAMRSLIRRDPEGAERLATELRDDLRQATVEIRRLVYDLRPPMLDELGLVGAIRNFGFQDAGVHFEVTAPEPMPALPAAVEVAAYRIASEACHNVVKHAGATDCHVTIEVRDHQLTLSVADNGQGMPEDLRGGVGVRSMRERAAELGGTLTVQAGETGGTCLTARLPLGG